MEQVKGGSQKDNKNDNIKTKGGKVAPMSPSAARLARRANDEKIIRNIKIAFTSVVTVAIIGVVISLFLFIYKPAVGTVGGMSIEQYEYSFYLRQMAQYSSGTNEEMSQAALEAAAEPKIMGIIAAEKGVTLTPENEQAISENLATYDQQAAENSQQGARLTGEDMIRSTYGVNKSQYTTLTQSTILATTLLASEEAAITITDEDAQARYDAALENYEEATVRHILFLHEGREGAETPRTREESEKLAQDTLARINAGEDRAALVQELSEDTDLTNEGIYTFRHDGSMDPGFEDWAFDPANNVGDTGITETTYGFHVMMLDARRDIPLDEVKQEIVDAAKAEQLDLLVAGWKAEPRFQIVKNEGVISSLNTRLLGQ